MSKSKKKHADQETQMPFENTPTTTPQQEEPTSTSSAPVSLTKDQPQPEEPASTFTLDAPTSSPFEDADPHTPHDTTYTASDSEGRIRLKLHIPEHIESLLREETAHIKDFAKKEASHIKHEAGILADLAKHEADHIKYLIEKKLESRHHSPNLTEQFLRRNKEAVEQQERAVESLQQTINGSTPNEELILHNVEASSTIRLIKDVTPPVKRFLSDNKDWLIPLASNIVLLVVAHKLEQRRNRHR